MERPRSAAETATPVEALEIIRRMAVRYGDARYTHRVAISNDRLLDIEHGRVSFSWKDYRDNNQRKTMALAAEEFIRRFLMQPPCQRRRVYASPRRPRFDQTPIEA
jgi:hypothetical protein